VVVGTDSERITAQAYQVLQGADWEKRRPRFWDGKTAERCLDVLAPLI